jgi:uncharacterized protein YhbP (UPF0306 family)
MDDRSRQLLAAHTTAVLSSVASDGTPRSCTIFYVFDVDALALIFKSGTHTEHTLSFSERPDAAMAVYNPGSGYAKKAGIQLIGRVQRVQDLDKMQRYIVQYSGRFPGAGDHFEPAEKLLAQDAAATLYSFSIISYKLNDGWENRVDPKYQDISMLRPSLPAWHYNVKLLRVFSGL